MATTADVPGRFDVAVDGTGFMLWEDVDQPALIHQSIRVQKEQNVNPDAIGESSVNPEGFWRRSIDGWSHGAGQSYFDRAESDPLRFHASQGVDVFATPHQATLLNSVDETGLVPTDFGFLITSGSRVYFRDGNTVKFVAAPTVLPWSTTTVTGTSTGGSELGGMATDGTTVYIAYGANGIYTTTNSTSVAASFITGTVSRVFYAKGRLIAMSGASVYNPVTSGALPTALLTLPSGGIWTAAAEGPNFIYLLAGTGTRAVVYKTQIRPDGTALDVPTVAGELPAGQDGIGIFSYAGRVFVTTNTASETLIQMADIDSDGNLTFGSSIVAAPGVQTYWGAHAGLSRFVWFGMTVEGALVEPYGTGLGRLDLTVATLPVTPAYAADLRVADGLPVDGGNRTVTSIVLVGTKVAFCVAGFGVYMQTDDYVESGYVTSGLVALDLADPKAPVAFDVEGAGLDTDHTIVEALSYDRGATFNTVGTWNAQTDGETPITGQTAVRQFEIKTTLTSDGDDTPTLYRHTLKVEPAVNQGDYVILRLRLYESVVTNTGESHTQNPDTLRAALSALQESRTAVTLQEGGTDYTVTVRDMDWEAHTRTAASSDGTWNGVATIRCKKVPV